MKIVKNIIQNNTRYGIEINDDLVRKCLIINNSFISNNIGGSSQAYEIPYIEGLKSYNTFIFNYWDDWTGPDNNHDGFVDQPYLIERSEDYDLYPLTYSNLRITDHFLTNPTLIVPEVDSNGYLNIGWKHAIDTYGYSVRYSLFYSNDSSNDQWIQLVNNSSDTFYSLNTNPFSSGCYKFRVSANSSSGLIAEAITNFVPINIDHILSSPQIINPSNTYTYSDNITIQWSPAIDNCYYSVFYNISYSNDGGSNWIFLVSGINSNTYNWDTTLLENGANYSLKIDAFSSGGLVSTTILNGSFSIINIAPKPFLEDFPFLELFFVLFIAIEIITLNFLVKLIRKKQKTN